MNDFESTGDAASAVASNALLAVREQLSDYAHDAWSGWMKYMFGKCKLAPDGESLIVPGWAVERWSRQMNTPYAELPDSEKQSDREEADKMLAIFHSANAKANGRETAKETA